MKLKTRNLRPKATIITNANKSKKKSMEIVSGAAFVTFYRLLKESIIRKESLDKRYKGLTHSSPKFWEIVTQKRFLELFKGSDVTTEDYFHRKFLYFKNNNKGPIDNEGFGKALRYIEDLPPKEIHPDEWEDTAKLFWKKFQIKYKSQIDKERKARKRKSTEVASNPSFETVMNVIELFYNSIRDQNFEKAWNLLTDDFQNRSWTWAGNFEKFKDGYSNTLKITDVKVFDQKEDEGNPDIIESRVLYLDHISSWTSKELSNLRDLKVKDIEIFYSRVKEITKHLDENGLNNFGERIELYKLFESSVTDYIAFRCDYPLSKLSNIFNSKQRCEVWRAMNIECKYNNGQWKIHRITGIPFVNLR